MTAVATQPRVTDATVDRRGRLTVTFKTDKRRFETVRMDIVSFETKTIVDIIESSGWDGKRYAKQGPRYTTGKIDFISDKFVVSNKRPKH